MNKLSIAAGVSIVFGGVIAGVNDWVFDISARSVEVTSEGSASLSAVFDSRSLASCGSVSGAVDSRCGDCQASNPTSLDTTKARFFFIVR